MSFGNTELSNIKEIPKTIILLIDKNENIVEACGKKLEHFNLEVKNKSLASIFSKKNHDLLKSLFDQELETIDIYWNSVNFEVSYQVVPHTNLRGLYFFDITKYSNMENELKKSMYDLLSKKEELQAVFDLAANGISILDRDGMFLYANNFFQKMMGYTMEELYNESCISLSSEEYKEPSESAVKRAIKDGSVVNFRKVCISKLGEYMNASMSLSYVKITDTIIMITSDITDDIKYQEELKRQVELEVSKRTEQYEIMCHQSRLAAMGEMIDSIAHQWRQPLNGLGIIVQGLRHISNKQEIDKALLLEIESEIMEKINYMSQTIDDFSNFFRISKQKEFFDIVKNINDAIRLIDVQLKLNNVKVEVEVEEKTTLNILGFPNEFRQVIMNMVHNAMMAIINKKEDNGFIVITIGSTKYETKITIQDNGGGIKKEYLEKIFDPYFTTREKGSGIGLYMSKVIIEHHMKGRLSVKNKANGALFTITLPKKEY